jgi:hypothetical protein
LLDSHSEGLRLTLILLKLYELFLWLLDLVQIQIRNNFLENRQFFAVGGTLSCLFLSFVPVHLVHFTLSLLLISDCETPYLKIIIYDMFAIGGRFRSVLYLFQLLHQF